MRVSRLLLASAFAFSVLSAFGAEAVKFDKSQLVGDDLPKAHRPDYPFDARRQHKTGRGVFILNISEKTGEVQSIQIKKSTGHKILDDACLKAMIAWRFKPQTVTKVWLPITFSMPPAP